MISEYLNDNGLDGSNRMLDENARVVFATPEVAPDATEETTNGADTVKLPRMVDNLGKFLAINTEKLPDILPPLYKGCVIYGYGLYLKLFYRTKRCSEGQLIYQQP